jgi:hypothetical protein
VDLNQGRHHPGEAGTDLKGSTDCPPRSTVAVTLITALSFAAAASAGDSCTNRSETPSITIGPITVPDRKSPVAY